MNEREPHDARFAGTGSGSIAEAWRVRPMIQSQV
jgi:hypothetical protein